jgi:hypothetical protein
VGFHPVKLSVPKKNEFSSPLPSCVTVGHPESSENSIYTADGLFLWNISSTVIGLGLCVAHNDTIDKEDLVLSIDLLIRYYMHAFTIPEVFLEGSDGQKKIEAGLPCLFESAFK